MLPYKLDTTKDLLTSRGGLLAAGQLLESLNLAQRIDQHFPLPNSNRGYPPSVFIQTLLLMQHEGSFHLDDVRHIQDDAALRQELNSSLYIGHIPGFSGAHSQAETLDELNRNLREVIEMLLEDGNPLFESEFVGTQQIVVA